MTSAHVTFYFNDQVVHEAELDYLMMTNPPRVPYGPAQIAFSSIAVTEDFEDWRTDGGSTEFDKVIVRRGLFDPGEIQLTAEEFAFAASRDEIMPFTLSVMEYSAENEPEVLTVETADPVPA